MINSVTQIPKTTNTSIFYINDLHGQTANMERITKASSQFDTFVPEQKTDKLKLAAGDILLGENPGVNEGADKFLNINKFSATAVGNHELDTNPEMTVKITNDAKYKLLGLNAKLAPDNKLNERITKSFIQEENGTKYGIIGLMPFDLYTRIKNKQEFNGLEVEKLDGTIKLLQEEVDKFKKQGVDKIIVLSHTGYNNDKKIAQGVEGIDVIIGGHSHDLVEGIKDGENLFYSKKTGEPTIITQAGQNGDYFGVLNLEFNENGVITKAQNNVTSSKIFSKSLAMKYVFDKIFGPSAKVGTIASVVPPPKKQLINENPHASLLADAIRSEMNVDIAMVNSANLRGNFEVGDIYERDISGITPFKNKMVIIKLNEKDLVDAIKCGGNSMTKADNKPGIFQVSGLKYIMKKNGELLEMKFVEKDGTEKQIDINNPNPFKIYSVGLDDYCAKGKDRFAMLDKYNNPETQKFDFDKDKLTADYIKKLNKPIDIKSDGRITIVE